MRRIRRQLQQHKITDSTAMVLCVALLVAGAVMIWAPQDAITAVVGFAGMVVGSLLPGLVKRRTGGTPDVREQLEQAAREPEEPSDR